MLKYEDIIDAPVGKLKTAADDWAEMVTKLDKLADDARDGMKVKADKAEWEGVNAGVTKAFIGKTAKEFEDAAAEAKGVKLVMEDPTRPSRRPRTTWRTSVTRRAPRRACTSTPRAR